MAQTLQQQTIVDALAEIAAHFVEFRNIVYDTNKNTMPWK